MTENILFDFDGTIFDTSEGIIKSLHYALSLRGMDEPDDSLKCFIGPPLIDMFMEHNGFTREEAERATADFRVRYEPIGVNECCLFDGIIDVIKAVKSTGRKVGVATSKPQKFAEMLLARENMTELFDVVCGSGMDGNNKTKADVLRSALKELGAGPDNTVLVGDTKWDILGAKEVGLDCIGVRWGFAEKGELEKYGAVMIADDMKSLTEILINY